MSLEAWGDETWPLSDAVLATEALQFIDFDLTTYRGLLGVF